MVAMEMRSNAATREATVAEGEPARTADERFAALTRRHVDAAFRLAWAILGDPSEAEDAAQEAFTAAWRKRDTLRDPASFEAWFQRILVNACRQRMRERRRGAVRAIDATDDRQAPVSELATPDGVTQLAIQDAVS